MIMLLIKWRMEGTLENILHLDLCLTLSSGSGLKIGQLHFQAAARRVLGGFSCVFGARTPLVLGYWSMFKLSNGLGGALVHVLVSGFGFYFAKALTSAVRASRAEV